MKDYEEALELRQGTKVIVTTYVRATGLNELSITSGTHPHNGLQTSVASIVSQLQTDILQEPTGSIFSMILPAKIAL